MATIPCPPFVLIEGIENFRDIGGYESVSFPSKVVRRNFIYRSADPTRTSIDGKAKLNSLGLKHMYDLRSAREVDRPYAPPPFDSPGITRHFTPVFTSNIDASPEGLAKRYAHYLHGGASGFAQAYKEILTAGKDSYRMIFLHIRNHPNQPLLFHCSAGKDRTGVLAMLILKLAGCSDDVVAREYQLTEIGSERRSALILEHILKNPNLKGTDQTAAMSMAGAKEESMFATLKMLRETFGGVEGYLKDQCDFIDADLDTMRENVLGEGP